MHKKPLLLFATPRSGSTIFYYILSEYLNRTNSVIGLSELFSPIAEYLTHSKKHYTDLTLQNYFTFDPDIETSIGKQFCEMSNYLQEALETFEKIRLVRMNPEKYFFKLMNHQIYSANQLEWLKSAYDWVFIERRNLFDQYLSHLISLETGVYYSSDGIRIPEKSLACPVALRSISQMVLLEYYKSKNTLTPKRILYYEDFVLNPDPGRILKLLDLPIGQYNPQLGPLPRKQNNQNKLTLFADPDAVLNSYKDSALQEISPIQTF
ncbi:MAG: hypothetical protein IT289_11445 [Oligoflexia bacterium]|nr:hypothetical protein [Oligoflexia bacterium]